MTQADEHLVFYGNCQLQVLAMAYDLLVVPHTGHSVTYIAAARPPTASSRAATARATTLVEQITPMGAQPGLDAVPPRARRLRVPVADGSFLWPYSGTRHPDSLRRYPSSNPFPMEFGDGWLVKALSRGETPDQAVANYLSLDIGRAAHLDRRLDIALDLQHTREAGTPYNFAPLIAQHFRAEPLFRSPYHLETRLFRHLLLSFLDHFGTPAPIRAVIETYATKTLFGGGDLPVHPGTAAHFGLQWANASTRYRFWRETVLTFEEYAHRFVRCEAYPEMTEAVEAVTKSRPDGAALLAQAMAAVPNSPWGLQALAMLKLRDGDADTATELLHRALALHPTLSGAYGNLHQCLMLQGEKTKAIDALLMEIRHEPYRIPLRIRLSQLLREAGRHAEARAQRDAVAALQGKAGGALPDKRQG